MTHRKFFIMKNAYASSERPWWVSQMTIDEERETVTHRVIFGPFATEDEAQHILANAGGKL